ncbi:MAG: hypothetical protein ACKVJE_15390 [Pseudomonadales bacterium]
MKKLIAIMATVVLLPTAAIAETFDEAFEMNRAMHGNGYTFTWSGEQFSTDHQEEVEARVDATKENAEGLIAKAKAHNAAVAKVGFEWKLTKGILKDAEAAVASGDYRKALNLAAQAKYHARIGLQQHAYAEKNWHLSVPQ